MSVFSKFAQIGRHRATGKRRRVNPVSDKRKDKNLFRNEHREAWLRLFPRCEVRASNPPCRGELTIHEPWTRARGGPIDDPRNWATACAGHNVWLSQTVTGLAWGEVHGLIFHEREGRAWLAVGGAFPGQTKEQVIAWIVAA